MKKLLVLLVGELLAKSCRHPGADFANAFFRVVPSKWEQKVAGCTNFSPGAVCYARCLPNFIQPKIDEISAKITCACSNDRCSWVASRDFGDCFGPCNIPQVSRKEVSKFFKIRADYSTRVPYFSTTSNAFLAVFRAQAKYDVKTWSQAIVFDRPQMWKVSSGEVDLEWNCNKRILMIRPKSFATNLVAGKSYSFSVLVENGVSKDIEYRVKTNSYSVKITVQVSLFLVSGMIDFHPEGTTIQHSLL